jgi:hypothetical protein
MLEEVKNNDRESASVRPAAGKPIRHAESAKLIRICELH